jgi:hypothetical protein
MKLTQLAKEPQLIRIELDDEEIRQEYNDSLEFWILDRQPMDQFIKLASAKSDDLSTMIEMVNGMILDENGQRILTGNLTLPTNIILKVVNKVTETLGK